jgi:transposase
MEILQNRHDLTDKQWQKIEPIILAKLDPRGGSNAKDDRIFVNGCFWIIRTGAPWRDLPPQYGRFNAVHRRYKRWCDKRIWDEILAELIDDPDYEWLMIDASHSKCHLRAADAIGGNQDMARAKGGLIPKFTLRWMRMVSPSRLLSQKVQKQIADKLYRL